MKLVFAVLTVAGLLVVAVFGFLAVGGMVKYGHRNCAVAAVAGQNCPETNSLAFVIFHLNALRNFGQAISAASSVSLVAVAALLAVFGLVFTALGVVQAGFIVRPLQERNLRASAAISQKQFVRWLALREKSPSRC